MKRIAYAEEWLTTDDTVADLVLEYARALARSETADTVTPLRVSWKSVASTPVTESRITRILRARENIERIGPAMSAGDKAAVATW